MRASKLTNFGDTVTLLANEGEKTVCRVSVDQLPEELRYLHALDPLQWTVTCRPLPCQYPAPGAPIVYVMLRIIWGHGGMSLKRDVDGSVLTKTTGAGSSVEVRARFVDVNGVTVSPSDAAFKGTSQVVNVSIAPGTDTEAEPQLWWTPIANKTFDAGPMKLPNASGLLTQQKLRRLRATQAPAAGAVVLWMQTHDSVAAPVNGVAPITSDQLAVEPADRDIDFGPQGHVYTKGLWVAMSTTRDTLTLAAGGTYSIQSQLYRLDSGDGTA